MKKLILALVLSALVQNQNSTAEDCLGNHVKLHAEGVLLWERGTGGITNCPCCGTEGFVAGYPTNVDRTYAFDFAASDQAGISTHKLFAESDTLSDAYQWSSGPTCYLLAGPLFPGWPGSSTNTTLVDVASVYHVSGSGDLWSFAAQGYPQNKTAAEIETWFQQNFYWCSFQGGEVHAEATNTGIWQLNIKVAYDMTTNICEAGTYTAWEFLDCYAWGSCPLKSTNWYTTLTNALAAQAGSHSPPVKIPCAPVRTMNSNDWGGFTTPPPCQPFDSDAIAPLRPTVVNFVEPTSAIIGTVSTYRPPRVPPWIYYYEWCLIKDKTDPDGERRRKRLKYELCTLGYMTDEECRQDGFQWKWGEAYPNN